jgi:hypothetical protein
MYSGDAWFTFQLEYWLFWLRGHGFLMQNPYLHTIHDCLHVPFVTVYSVHLKVSLNNVGIDLTWWILIKFSTGVYPKSFWLTFVLIIYFAWSLNQTIFLKFALSNKQSVAWWRSNINSVWDAFNVYYMFNKIQGEVIYACIQCSVFVTIKVEVSWSSKTLVST